MAETRLGRRTIWRALAGGLLVAGTIGIVWLLVGPRPGLSPLRDDDVSQLITEQWVQIYYDRSSPVSRSDGDITIVAFLDHASTDCRKLAAALNQLHGLDRGVQTIFKEIAAPGSIADFTSRALLAADRQDRFLLLHRELIQGPRQITESSVIMAAGMAGLDITRLRADMEDPAIAKALEENRSLAHALGIRAPALIIGNRIYRDTTDLKALQVVVAQARSGTPQ
jgi:protein-disulfide isomerase